MENNCKQNTTAWLEKYVPYYRLKPRPHQQQRRSNIGLVECQKSYGFSTKSKQTEHVQFVSTLPKGRNFMKNSFENGNNVEETFDFVERIDIQQCFSTLLLVWTGRKED